MSYKLYKHSCYLHFSSNIDLDTIIGILKSINVTITEIKFDIYRDIYKILCYHKDLPEIVHGNEIPNYILEERINEGYVPETVWSIKIK